MLTCPLCRRELQAAGGTLFRCGSAHVIGARTLLAEQSRLASAALREVAASLESTLALSGELASKAQADGQTHLLRYLEREIDFSRETLIFVQDLRDGGDLNE